MNRQYGRGKGGRGMQRSKHGKNFLIPCLLLVLSKKDQHGYDLHSNLETLIPDIEEYDPSIIYRLLRGMETEGIISSYQGAVSRGPKRRIYTITETGRRELYQWVEHLKNRRTEIDNFLSLFQQYRG